MKYRPSKVPSPLRPNLRDGQLSPLNLTHDARLLFKDCITNFCSEDPSFTSSVEFVPALPFPFEVGLYDNIQEMVTSSYAIGGSSEQRF